MSVFLVNFSISLLVIWAIYKVLLEQEKMHAFNRTYLLLGMTFSLLVTFLPNFLIRANSIDAIPTPALSTSVVASGFIRSDSSYSILTITMIGIYFTAVVLLTIKFIYNFYQLIRLGARNPKVKYKNAHLVLLENTTLPFSFFNNIFVNGSDFKNKRIDEQIIEHEYAHTQLHHSWDILFIEILTIVFWFNPFLILYKRSIQLNHEFQADEVVVKVKNNPYGYQKILLSFCTYNKQIYLASNINFQLTKKRLHMITKTSTTLRKVILQIGTVPVFILLLMLFGNPIVAQDSEQVIVSKEKYFEHAYVVYEGENDRMYKKLYGQLSDEIKKRIPPPPPAHSGMETTLEEGTVVYLKENGTIKFVEKRGWLDIPKPPAPPVPPATSSSPVPPMPPTPPVAPSIASIADLAQSGATFYINGKKVMPEVAKTICGIDDDSTYNVTINNGNIRVDINTKDK